MASESGGGRKRLNSVDLLNHLNSGDSHQIFAVQGHEAAYITTRPERDDPEPVDVTARSTEDTKEFARTMGAQDMKQLSALPPEQLELEHKRMEAFVVHQREQVAAAWGEGRVNVFEKRSKELLGGASANKFRTSTATQLAGRKVSGWDENIQTEIVANRIEGRAAHLEKLRSQSHPNIDKLDQFHALLAESSSLARSPTSVVAGSLNVDVAATVDTESEEMATYASMAHPAPVRDSAGSEQGRSVGASPRAHMLRTRMMQANERVMLDNKAGVVDRQIGRVLTARRATTNAFEAPTTANTNAVFEGSHRHEMMAFGREIDKKIHNGNVEIAKEISPENVQRTRASSVSRDTPSK